ncbi:MAG: hypothetical protein VX447_12785 [Pseudomonadota bacterium]|uniref:hypothetical protein n=1 Tax=Gallaecimonas pentaromativorans TaxID=584787 RepID=UPI00067EA48F|nr:hypothetical protein [Gallaecimonas pentaromativorans]MED5525611.1 hypothetical protein [Pseudomonadota bacterium]
MKKTLFSLPMCIFIYGCGSSPIDVVKEYRMFMDESYTVEQAFEHRDVCSGVDWSSFKDKRGRTIVEYKCDLRDSKTFLTGLTETKLSRFRSQKRQLLEVVERDVQQAQSSLESLKSEYKKANVEIANLNESDLKDSDFYSHFIHNATQPTVNCVLSNIRDADMKSLCVRKIKEEGERKIYWAEDKYNKNKEELQSFVPVDEKKENKIISNGYVSAKEVIQWAIVDGESPHPTLQYTGIDYLKKNGEVISKPVSSSDILNEVYYGHSKDAKTYIYRVDPAIDNTLLVW